MRTLLYVLSGATALTVLIVFFQNLGVTASANVSVLGATQMTVRSGTIIFFSSIIGAIAASFTCFGVYFDEIFGKKETVWSGTQKEDISQGQTKDDWENTDW